MNQLTTICIVFNLVCGLYAMDYIRPIPDHALIMVDHKYKVYYYPHCVGGKIMSVEEQKKLPERMTYSTRFLPVPKSEAVRGNYADVKEKGYNSAIGCSENGMFYRVAENADKEWKEVWKEEQAKINRRYPFMEKRWNEDGTWNW